MKINKESFKYLKKFINSINYENKMRSLSEIMVATAIQTIIENINYENKKYSEILKEIYEVKEEI